MRTVSILVVVVVLALPSQACRIDSWLHMDNWFGERLSGPDDCKWMCDHVSSGCMDYTYARDHMGTCHTYSCVREECLLRKWFSMDTWYPTRSSTAADCAWLCDRHDTCVRHEFSPNHAGTCHLYDCTSSPPAPSRPPRWRPQQQQQQHP